MTTLTELAELAHAHLQRERERVHREIADQRPDWSEQVAAYRRDEERRGPDTKPTNPKDVIGSQKLPMELVPDVPEEALAFLEGALKYGRFNWRIAGVRVSIYCAAIRRHFTKYWNGEDADKRTRIKHLLSIIACCKILLDAERCGKLTDDRPPAVDMEPGIVDAEEIAKHLRELFKDHNPKQYTISDSALASSS